MRKSVSLVWFVALAAVFLSTGCSDDERRGGEDAGTDTDVDTDTDADAGADSGADASADTDTDADDECTDDTACEGLGLICNESWGICVVASCEGEDDFTPCESITDPDRSYDVCIEDTCQSPGCGTAVCNTPGPHFPLADTNLRVCCDDNSNMTCPEPGQDLYGQDAQYGWDAANDSSLRFTRDVSINVEPVVLDNVTGLMWQGCTNGQSGASCELGVDIRYDWAAALALCDSLEWGGYDDWRLPDEYELHSIVNYGEGVGTIDGAAFPESPSYYFWTSSTSASDEAKAREVVFENAGFLSASEKTFTDNVRCVRLGPTPRPERFTLDTLLSGQPVVIDAATDLEWQGCAADATGDTCEPSIDVPSYSWLQALAYCEDLIWAGHDDWRLPNVKELESIIDNHVSSPAIDR